MSRTYYILLLSLAAAILSCVNSRQSFSITKSRVQCHYRQDSSCSYISTKGIILGDEPGYFIDSAYLSGSNLIISIKPGKYNFDPVKGEVVPVKFQSAKFLVYTARQRGDFSSPKKILQVKFEEDRLIIPVNNKNTQSFLVSTEPEFGMTATLIRLKKND